MHVRIMKVGNGYIITPESGNYGMLNSDMLVARSFRDLVKILREINEKSEPKKPGK